MFNKTLTAAVAVLTLTTATFTAPQSAQAGNLGTAIVAGVVGTVVGVVAGAARANADDRPAYRQVRGAYSGDCGVRVRPVFDEYGNKVGVRNVSAC